MTVWDAVVGQTVLDQLRAAAASAAEQVRRSEHLRQSAMTHAWLIAGPPGSGRSVLAKAFAASLLCPDQGCGECSECRTSLSGAHPDVTIVATEGLTIGVDRVRSLVHTASLRPASGRWQVLVVEDADRLTDEAADALLLSIEEPPERTVWLLCVPAADEMAPTIRSRCRLVCLRTPPAESVAAALVGEGVDQATASFAARASLGHIGRARGLATDEDARHRREEVLRLPQRVDDLAEALEAAAKLIAAAEDDATEHCDALDRAEMDQFLQAQGAAAPGKRVARVDRGARSELEKDQKRRRTRVKRDSLDRALVDVLALYRDVFLLQVMGSAATDRLVNAEMAPSLARLAEATSADATLRRMEAVMQVREALDGNASPLLALEGLAVTLAREGGRHR